MACTITVYGIPAPQGSKSFKGLAKSGRAILTESSKRVKPWRESCVAAALENGARITGPVAVEMIFTMPKPKSAPKKRVTFPDKKPDIDKCCRSTGDALVTAGVIEDDARIVSLYARKVFPGEHPKALHVPGVVITIAGIEHAEQV